MSEIKQREFREIDGVIYCDRPRCPGSTGLRCYRTGVPICKKCAVRTPVGYLSIDAAREQQNQFYDATSLDYAKVGAAAFFISLPASIVALLISGFLFGFFGWILAFFFSTAVGGVISEAAFRLMRPKRGRYTAHVVAGAIALSVLPLLLISLLVSFPIGLLIYAVAAISTASGRLRIKV